MPRMKPEQYTAQNETVLKLAAREGGVTINEIIEAIKNGDKNISRPRAEKLVKEVLNLPVIKRDGRTQFFGSPGMTALPPVVKTGAASKSGTSPQARLSKLLSRAETLTAQVTKVLAEIDTIKAEIATANVIEVVPNTESAPATETAPAATETAAAN